GAYHSKFGRLENDTLYSLYEKAVKGTLDDAGVEPESIDGIFVGNYSGGTLNNQENIAPYGVNVLSELRHKPMYRTETACTSGSSAIHMGIMAIKSGLMNRVLVIGLEKMTAVDTAAVTKSLALATYWPDEGAKSVTAPCMFADLAKGWLNKHGYSQDQLQQWLAQISAKAYTHGASNPLAHITKPRSAEEILSLPDEKNPMIYEPLRLHDCSLISDGASGLILEADPQDKSKAIRVKSFYNASDYLDSFGKNKSDHFLEGAHYAVNKTLKEADLSLADINLAEVHDCFTITELLIYSALGITQPGREFEAIEDKSVFHNGRLPINLSGGLKAKGHPIGATGVSMHAYIYKQLIGEAYNNQVEKAQNGITVNIGGAGTSNCVSVLGID
ncbi:propanoyl-CoA acyltransferase, partial [Fulvivirga sp. RKSG066]|uniref:thiolase C-terminal domain-containing protein n=1 Tax=Fulvivirga aurantia TaxID=2529383 RepID=UPI0012BC4BB0